MREAIPVGRFSSDKQEQGDSEQRQGKAIERILNRHELRLSTRYQAIFDRSRSAFKGEHLRVGELGKFLRQVKEGEIKPDDNGLMPVLCFEAVDRLTRLHPVEANQLLKELVDNGLAVVFDEADLWIDKDTIADKWIMLQVLIEQAWRYSKRLQTRMKSSWENRRKQDEPPTTICPCWLNYDPEQKVFRFNEFAIKLTDACEMAIDGHGASEIRKRLNMKHVSQANLTRIFHMPELMGAHQFKVRNADGTRAPVGKIRQGYYPQLLTELEYHQLQEALESRRTQKGRRGDHCTNLFTHLLINESDGTELIIKKRSSGKCVLISQNKKNALSKHPNLNYDIVEKSLLTLFIRLKKSDLQPAQNKPDKMSQISASILTLERRHQQYVELQLDHPEKIILRSWTD